jgi:hypothetical protein
MSISFIYRTLNWLQSLIFFYLIKFIQFYLGGREPTSFPALADNSFCAILLLKQTLQGELVMAKDKDKGKEKSNKPKLSVKEKKLKKKEKLNKKASMA